MTNTYNTHLLRHYRHKIGDNIYRIRARLQMPLLHEVALLADLLVADDFTLRDLADFLEDLFLFMGVTCFKFLCFYSAQGSNNKHV